MSVVYTFDNSFLLQSVRDFKIAAFFVLACHCFSVQRKRDRLDTLFFMNEDGIRRFGAKSPG